MVTVGQVLVPVEVAVEVAVVVGNTTLRGMRGLARMRGRMLETALVSCISGALE